MKRITNGLTILGLVLASAPAAAQDGAIELRATAQKRVVVAMPDGKEHVQLLPTDRVVPGDVVAYTIEARNVSDRPADRVIITDPIPKHMEYVGGSAESPAAQLLFSVDGGMRFDAAQRLEVVEADGTSRPAIAEDYTHVRWILAEPLAPSQKQSVKFLAELQ